MPGLGEEVFLGGAGRLRGVGNIVEGRIALDVLRSLPSLDLFAWNRIRGMHIERRIQ